MEMLIRLVVVKVIQGLTHQPYHKYSHLRLSIILLLWCRFGYIQNKTSNVVPNCWPIMSLCKVYVLMSPRFLCMRFNLFRHQFVVVWKKKPSKSDIYLSFFRVCKFSLIQYLVLVSGTMGHFDRVTVVAGQSKLLKTQKYTFIILA